MGREIPGYETRTGAGSLAQLDGQAQGHGPAAIGRAAPAPAPRRLKGAEMALT